jgi:two-component system response regulator VicR
MNLLLVDDERLFVKGLSASLRKEGFNVFTAFDGNKALEILESGEIDIVLLDIMLPGMDGITLLKKIRQQMDIPVIMLTAKDDYADMVLGLELGADDYITKPFHTRVLVARIHTIMRRIGAKREHAHARQAAGAPDTGTGEGVLVCGRLKIDLNMRTLYKGEKEIDLTAKEFDILCTLVRNSGIVLSREKIYDIVWQELDCDTRTVDVHISKLREKIEDDPANPSYIRTKWGVGYYFRKEDGV